MTTAELVNLVAQRLQISKRAARHIVQAKLALLRERLLDEGAVAVKGFGKFSIGASPCRELQIPGKEGRYFIPARNRAMFSAYASFKKRIKRPARTS